MSRTALLLMLLVCVANAGELWAQDDAVVNEQRLHGRALYRGEIELAQGPQLNTVTIASMSCAQCHGREGAGTLEAGIQVPSVQWRKLMLGNVRGPGYANAANVVAAISEGQGRDGKPLQAPMPNFTLTDDERDALIAYLQVLGTEADLIAGVTPDQVTVASVLPLSGPQAGIGALIRQSLQTRFATLNAQGGLFGRQIKLEVIDGAGSAADASLAARHFIEQDNPTVFALVGSLLPTPDSALQTLLHDRQIPMVATLGVPQTDSTDAQITYLLPGLVTQVRHLAAELSKQCPQADSSTLLLYRAGDPLAEQLLADDDQLTPQPVSRTEALGAQLNLAFNASRVIALLDAAQLAEVRRQLNSRSTPSCLGSLAAITGALPEGTPSLASGKVHEWVALPMPSPVPPADGLSANEHLWTVLADAAAQTFIETLSRSGRQLNPQRFSDALNTLQHYQPGPGLVLNFNRRQRHGFDVGLWTGGDHVSTDN